MRPMRTGFLCALLLSCLALRSAELALPEISAHGPAAGRRSLLTAPEYQWTEIRHQLALPDDWTPDWQARGKRWPIIVEYTGNYFPTSGSTGKVDGAALGYGLSRGRYLWVVLPYVAADHRRAETTWWGDIDATVGYARTNVPRICAEFGGDPRKVVLCGFSRGAIGVGFLGLHDDDTARLWCGFFAHDHFDGAREWKNTKWGSPLTRYREEASARLRRLGGRPLLVTQNGADTSTREFLGARLPEKSWTYLEVDMTALFGPFPNSLAPHPHNDRWLFRETPAAKRVEEWLQLTLQGAEKASEPAR